LLRFRLNQFRVESMERYFLPLPKMGEAHVAMLSSHLEDRGFDVRKSGGGSRLLARKGAVRISIDGALGLASSARDMLDALAPAIPSLLASPVEGTGRDLGALYFSLKRSPESAELQFFPRLESSRTWDCLRREGLCGLTPDEASVLNRILHGSLSARIGCVTSRPRGGSTTLQEGRKLYYRSSVTAAEFLSSLRTTFSDPADSACFLPKSSLIELPPTRLASVSQHDLGEWCLLG
jgi:hypothetical protein